MTEGKVLQYTNKKRKHFTYYGNLPLPSLPPLPLSLPPYLCTLVKLPASLLPTINCRSVSASGTIPFIHLHLPLLHHLVRTKPTPPYSPQSTAKTSNTPSEPLPLPPALPPSLPLHPRQAPRLPTPLNQLQKRLGIRHDAIHLHLFLEGGNSPPALGSSSDTQGSVVEGTGARTWDLEDFLRG